MAQELHDVLGHNISLINVRAGVALHLIDHKPEEARAALEAIKDASKDALSELRTVLGLLHREGESAPRSPAPGIGQVDQLASDARASGLSVEFRSHGAIRTLAPAVDLAAFRIVQEALTNVMRHAKSNPVSVDLRYGDDEVVICVDDAGHPVGPDSGHGRGISGMRERAVALGGSLTAGPRADGGFRVLARLPYGDSV
jgi:signal transduction histidine kinase